MALLFRVASHFLTYCRCPLGGGVLVVSVASPLQSPMADIEFWRDRNASVGTVYEQISSVPALRLLEVLQYKDGLGESEVHSAFVELKKELSNLYSEAKV